MPTMQKKLKASGKTAAVLATAAGKKAARKAANAADSMLVKLGNAAKKRQRARKTKAALKTAGKFALVLGAGAVTAFAGKSALARARGEARKRK